MTVIQFPERVSYSQSDIDQLKSIVNTSSAMVALAESALDGSYMIDNVSDEKMERIRLSLTTLGELSKSLQDYASSLIR